MAFRKNTTLKNNQASVYNTQFPAGSTMEIRTGSQPASANDAATGTVLATITLPASPWSAASGGVISKNGTWSATASATGTAGWARITGGSNVMDVSVGTSGADAIIDNASIVSGGTVTVTSLSVTIP
jgi:hypothetical protein